MNIDYDYKLLRKHTNVNTKSYTEHIKSIIYSLLEKESEESPNFEWKKEVVKEPYTYDIYVENKVNNKGLIIEIDGSVHFYDFYKEKPTTTPPLIGKSILKRYLLNNRIQRMGNIDILYFPYYEYTQDQFDGTYDNNLSAKVKEQLFMHL